MRISDWSSDVCSSDLMAVPQIGRQDGQSLLDIVAGTIPAQQRGDRIAVAQVVNAGSVIGVAGVTQADLASDVAKNQMERSEERRVGKECVSTCRSRWSPNN